MNKYTVDSSFIINYLKDREGATDFYNSLNSDSKVLIPIIAEAEVKYVKRNIGKFDEIDSIEFRRKDLTEFLKILDFLEERGERINMIDMIIAAQTVNREAILITFDQDFEKLEEYPRFEYKKLSAE